jgi:hypothetical protein
MKKEKISKHLIEDRMDRYVTIATKVGIGEVQYTVESNGQYGFVKIELTSTGVIIVRSVVDDMVITLYCATVATIKRYFGFERMPLPLYNAVRSNERRGYCNI